MDERVHAKYKFKTQIEIYCQVKSNITFAHRYKDKKYKSLKENITTRLARVLLKF